jgi:aspartate/methionine/tyrosine aminotransferase
MRRLNDLFGVLPPHVAERMSVVALDRLPAFRRRANAMIDANRAAYEAILGGHPGLDQVAIGQGTTVFPRLAREDGDTLFRRLMADYQTSVVPGRFFGRPDRIRVGLAGEAAMTRTGLERLAMALRV